MMASEPSLPSFRLRPPPLPGELLSRAQVRGALLATESGSTCVICAAPGYGATTAVVQALCGTSDAVCWVSLDSSVGDDEACALFAAAVGGDAAELDDVTAALADGGASWVVVDGLDPTVHPRLTAILGALVQNLPCEVRLIVTSHHDLGWPVTVWDERLLEFTDDEALELLTLTCPDVHIDQASEVLRLAQGWPCALVAAAARLRTQGGADRLRDTLAADLLATWFETLPPEHRTFLEQTAILDLLGEGPAAQITGRPDVGALLTGLAAAHCYLRSCPAPEGHPGRWWRRHPLLTVWLRQRTSGLDLVAAHDAAASWFAQTPDVYATMQHMLAAGRYTDAAAYLDDHEVQLLSTGQAPQVLQWYGKLADARAHEIDAMIRGVWAMVLARDVVGADAAYARLEAALAAQRATADATEREEQQLAAWAGETALLQAYLAAFRGDPATVVVAARKAMQAPSLERLADLAQLAPILEVRGLLWASRADEAQRRLSDLSGTAGVNPVMREVHLAGARALMHCAQGQITTALSLTQGIQAWSQASGIDSRQIQIYAPALAQAWAAAESGHLEEAETLARSLLDETAARGHLCDATWSALILSKAQVGRGDYGAALRSVTRAREIAVSRTPASELLVGVNQQQALVHMATGDFIRADRTIRQLPPSPARTLLAARAGVQQQPARARRMLEGLQPDSPRAAAQRHLLLAAVQATESRRLAQGHLHHAGAIARESGQRMLLYPPIPGISDLIAATTLASGDESLKWLSTQTAPDGAPVAGQPAKLSRGELQLLLLLPTRAKNIDIADQLGVSVNTVKTRLRRLYVKLAAGSRDEAITNARARGLID